MQKGQRDTPAYSIGTVARLLDVSVEVLRLYERRGLILSSRSDGKQRLYSESDVERLRCIRAAINDHKISIEGIRRIHAMIPCWEHVCCSVQERDACPAYCLSQAGCWTYKHQGNPCAQRDCRSCKVYQMSSDCEKVKGLIQHRMEAGLLPVQNDQEG